MWEFFMDAGLGWTLSIFALIGGAIWFMMRVRKKLYGGTGPKKKGIIK